jgi:DNA-binding MarR family transcriptional regulator
MYIHLLFHDCFSARLETPRRSSSLPVRQSSPHYARRHPFVRGGASPPGLRATQFTILQALQRTGEITQGELGELLAIDSTTLTRTLHIMRRNGWVAERPGEDRRERWLQLAKAGRELLARTTPAWEKTQSRLTQKLGEGPWHTLFKLTGELTNLAQSLGDLS